MFRVFGGYIPSVVARPAVAASGDKFDRKFVEYAEHAAEPDRSTEPPFAVGTRTLEFGSFDKSGLGGR